MHDTQLTLIYVACKYNCTSHEQQLVLHVVPDVRSISFDSRMHSLIDSQTLDLTARKYYQTLTRTANQHSLSILPSLHFRCEQGRLHCISVVAQTLLTLAFVRIQSMQSSS